MTLRFVSTKTHGVLDYLSVGTLVAVPRLLGWSPRVTNLLTGAATGTLVYSLLTRYELGLKGVLPMTTHLTLDALSGALLCAAPALLPDEDDVVVAALVGFGAFELGAALTTKTESPVPAASQGPPGNGRAPARPGERHGDR